VAEPVPAAELGALWAELEADGPRVGVVLGRDAERELVEPALAELRQRAISFEVRVLPPLVDPRAVAEYASNAALRGLRVLIVCCSGAGGLAATVAAYTELPVIGVPIRSSDLGGLDSLLATVQMPPGVPVGCMALNGARNAAIFAARILAQAPPDEL
jgi:5-(carboxyamino)imidazole ribonucleotide mutase